MPQASDGRLRRTRRRSVADAYSVDIQRLSGVRSPVSSGKLVALAQSVLRAERVQQATLSISLVSRRRIAALNAKHLAHSGPTDVITFAMGIDPMGMLVADIYICPDVAREQALAHHVGVREELARLVVHGVLHACGYEHPELHREASDMWTRQELLLRRYFRREVR